MAIKCVVCDIKLKRQDKVRELEELGFAHADHFEDSSLSPPINEESQ